MSKDYNRTYRYEVKKYLNKIKEKGCSLCGYRKCFDALDFHHVTQDKTYSISKLTSVKPVIEELKKCILVCANCHREIHSGNIEGFPNIRRAVEDDSQIEIKFG
jgi:hypothetical protein